MPDPTTASLNLRISAELRNRLETTGDLSAMPLVRIVETLLRDDLNLPPVYPGLAARLRKMAR